MTRQILHVDMDAFFASVAQRDHPEWRGKPVIVGGHSIKRGVVASASYEARAFGVRSAMPLYKAYELCPHAIQVPVSMEKYRVVNQQLRQLWERFAPVVEPLGFEEAYLDMTGTERLLGPLEGVAVALREAIACETGLSASVGGGTSKLLAKVASKAAKPAGVCIVRPGEEEAWLHPRDVGILPGVGRRMQGRLNKLGIMTVGQLAEASPAFLMAHFGEQGVDLLEAAQGKDPRLVSPAGARKSIGGEETFDQDSRDPVFLKRTLLKIACEIGYRLRRHGAQAGTISAKVRYAKTFQTVERSVTLALPTQDDEEIYATAWKLVKAGWDGKQPLRLLGASLSNFKPGAQLRLFETANPLTETLDRLRDRYGMGVIQRGSLTVPDRPGSEA
ncbi:DNA polymerase IV [compost metagenome]